MNEVKTSIVKKHNMCKVDGCFEEATYREKSKRQRIACEKHATEDHIKDNTKEYTRVKTGECYEVNCRKKAIYGWLDKNVCEYCTKHAREGMADLMHRLCIFKGCVKRATLYNPTTCIAEYCAKHRPNLSYISIRRSTCKVDGCTKCRAYCHVDGPALYCRQHKEPGMISYSKKIKDRREERKRKQIENETLDTIQAINKKLNESIQHNIQSTKLINDAVDMSKHMIGLISPFHRVEPRGLKRPRISHVTEIRKVPIKVIIDERKDAKLLDEIQRKETKLIFGDCIDDCINDYCINNDINDNINEYIKLSDEYADLERIEAERIEAERIEAERIEVDYS